jgi:DNA polymerase I-like protein with 3'-5' exonuclease and polymerase domains
MCKIVIGLDIETYDPLLKTAGWSWKYKQGYILCTALYYEDTDTTEVIAGLKNTNCAFTKEKRASENAKIVGLLQNPNVCMVGANLQYDIGWLLYEYGMSTYDVKCSFVDVLQAESILDEFNIHTLDLLSHKYLKHGKVKDEIEEYVHQNISTKGDFRKYLKEVPFDIISRYVTGDAVNPVKIWRKQLTLLKEQDLCKRAKLEFDCILPILQITKNGYVIDKEQKQKNLEKLTQARDMLKKEFQTKYKVNNFNVNSSQHIAGLCDTLGVPYRCKITLKGFNGKPFANYKENDLAYAKAKKLVSSFQYVKSVPVAFVPSSLAERTCDLLKEEGFMFTCSPNVDKKFFSSQRDNYEVIALIADWKQANSIISKILGDKYDRFILTDEEGISRVHGQFKITDTISFRLSSNNPNCQQIPSKGGLKIKGEEISFPLLTRALFKPRPNEVLWKIDYGQIEYRLICEIAVGEAGKKVREEYKQNPKLDFHQYVVDLTKLSRKYAKNMSFGKAFGMGVKSMAESFGWTLEQAEEITKQYDEYMPFVSPTLELVGDVAKQRGYIRTICGSHARLPNPNKSYTMLNRFTQGSGAEIMKSSIVRAYKEGVWKEINPCNTVHDELNGSVAPSEDKIRKVYELARIMTTTVPTKVPMEAEPEFGMNWAETKTILEWLSLKGTSEWDKLPAILKETILIADRIRGEYEL